VEIITGFYGSRYNNLTHEYLSMSCYHAIAISRVHYEALLKLGHKNETFDHIVGNLLKNAKASGPVE